jgi:hypothetical protein
VVVGDDCGGNDVVVVCVVVWCRCMYYVRECGVYVWRCVGVCVGCVVCICSECVVWMCSVVVWCACTCKHYTYHIVVERADLVQKVLFLTLPFL